MPKKAQEKPEILEGFERPLNRRAFVMAAGGACAAAAPCGSWGSWALLLEGEPVALLEPKGTLIEAKNVHAGQYQRPQERGDLFVGPVNFHKKASGAGLDHTHTGGRSHYTRRSSAVA